MYKHWGSVADNTYEYASDLEEVTHREAFMNTHIRNNSAVPVAAHVYDLVERDDFHFV